MSRGIRTRALERDVMRATRTTRRDSENYVRCGFADRVGAATTTTTTRRCDDERDDDRSEEKDDRTSPRGKTEGSTRFAFFRIVGVV
jgi:hypothetical protein